ncbi:MAG: diacylglycerol kinase family protein [candidate division Zixibacteria bacterium]
MENRHIDVIATTISGSIKDWGKIPRIVPLFESRGESDVRLCTMDSHAEARRKTAELIRAGGKIIISAGGSGTFNAVLEGCFDSGRDLKDLRLGFLRKGSADLIGKVLGMPDDIEKAIDVFVSAIRQDRVVPCDVILVTDSAGEAVPRRFVGYSGAELFGRIPHYTENRFIKYYKGILSQLFGDLGPFFIGTSLAIIEKVVKRIGRGKRRWRIIIDDKVVADSSFQSMIIVNGDLGKDLPFAKSEPLGSGKFYLFTIEDKGILRLFGQLKHAWDASITENPEKYGFGSFIIEKNLVLEPEDSGVFPVNIDGSTMKCGGSARFEICDQIRLLGGHI